MAKLLLRVSCAAVATTALAFLASCVTYSIHPLFDRANSVFEPGLIGTWIDPTTNDKRATLKLEKGERNSYKATLFDISNDPATDALFEASLVKLNGRLFFDALNTKNLVNGVEANVGIAIPAHLIGRLSLDGDTFHYDPLDDEWLKKGLNSGKITLAHELVDGDIVLTASTADLQKFVSAHANDDEAFPPSSPLHRVK
jgi:hypothetical protein